MRSGMVLPSIGKESGHLGWDRTEPSIEMRNLGCVQMREPLEDRKGLGRSLVSPGWSDTFSSKVTFGTRDKARMCHAHERLAKLKRMVHM